MTVCTYTSASTGRRVGTWLLDVIVVGAPCFALSFVIPVLPVGSLLWVCYRMWCAWSGRSIARDVTQCRVRAHGDAPRWRGVAHLALAVFPFWVFVLAEVLIWAVVEPSSWWSGLLSVLAGGVVGGAMSTIAAVSLWSAGAGDVPRIDRWCGVRFERRTTSTSAPFHTVSAA